MNDSRFVIGAAVPSDVTVVLSLIKELAAYERLADQVVTTEKDIRNALFSDQPIAEVVIGRYDDEPVGFALFFHSFSTFLGRPGLYLEDLYVRDAFRGRGFGRRLLAHVARLAVDRQCGRMEWSVLDWNELAIQFYRRVGAVPMDGWVVYRLTGRALEQLAREGRLP